MVPYPRSGNRWYQFSSERRPSGANYGSYSSPGRQRGGAYYYANANGNGDGGGGQGRYSGGYRDWDEPAQFRPRATGRFNLIKPTSASNRTPRAQYVDAPTRFYRYPSRRYEFFGGNPNTNMSLDRYRQPQQGGYRGGRVSTRGGTVRGGRGGQSANRDTRSFNRGGGGARGSPGQGRSQGRGRGRGGRGGFRGGRGGRGGMMSKEKLDAELDAYMGDGAVKTRLDSELDLYMGRVENSVVTTSGNNETTTVTSSHVIVASSTNIANPPQTSNAIGAAAGVAAPASDVAMVDVNFLEA